MKQRVTISRAVAARTMLLAPIALSSAPAAAQQTPPPVSFVATPSSSTGVAPLYYAAQQHWLERAGLDVSIVPATGGAASVTAVVGGAAQVGFTNTLQLITAHAKGIPLTLIAPGTQADPAHPFVELVVKSDSTLKSPKDLEDQVFGVTALHDLSTLTTTVWLRKNGVDPSRVKLIELPPEAALPALLSGRIVAYSLYEPFLSVALAGGAKVFANPLDAVDGNALTGAWFAAQPWASQNRDAVIRFARVLSQAATYVDAHYEDLIPMISGYTKIPVATLQRVAFNKIQTAFDVASFQSLIDAAAASHEIAKPFPAKELIFPGVP